MPGHANILCKNSLHGSFIQPGWDTEGSLGAFYQHLRVLQIRYALGGYDEFLHLRELDVRAPEAMLCFWVTVKESSLWIILTTNYQALGIREGVF